MGREGNHLTANDQAASAAATYAEAEAEAMQSIARSSTDHRPKQQEEAEEATSVPRNEGSTEDDSVHGNGGVEDEAEASVSRGGGANVNDDMSADQRMHTHEAAIASPSDVNGTKSNDKQDDGQDNDENDTVNNGSDQVQDENVDAVDDMIDTVMMEAVGAGSATSTSPTLAAQPPHPPTASVGMLPPRPQSQSLMDELDLGFAAPYLQKLAPLRVGSKTAAALAADAASPTSRSSSAARRSPLRIRPRSGSTGGGDESSSSAIPSPSGGGTKGSKRFEARWGRLRLASPPSSQQSSQPDAAAGGGLNEPIPLSRSISAPSTGAIHQQRMGGRQTPTSRTRWRTFRRGSSLAAMAATGGSPSWEEESEEDAPGGRTRQDYIEEGYSEQLSSSEDEYDEGLDEDLYRRSDGYPLVRGMSDPLERLDEDLYRRSDGYPLALGISDPLHGFRRQSSATPHTPHSPLSGDSFADEDDLMNSPHSPRTPHSFDTDSPIRIARSHSMSSSDDSSLDSDTFLELDLDEEEGMGRLAQELATPLRRARSSRSGRNRFHSPRLSSRGRSTSGSGMALEGVAEAPNEDADGDDADEHVRELDLEEGGGVSTDLVAAFGATVTAAAAAAASNVNEPEIETVSTVEGSSPDSMPLRDGQDGRKDEGVPDDYDENVEPGDDQPPILPTISSIQMSGSVEYYNYDPEAPLSPPPEAFACPTPLASNMRTGFRDPSLLQLPGPALSPGRFDENEPPPTMPSIDIGPMAVAAATMPIRIRAAPAVPHRWRRRPKSDVPSIISRGSTAADTKSTFMSMFTLITKEHMDFKTLFYLSIFSIFGSTLRVYISRIFGYDCEFPDLVGDWFANGFKNICVTASGRTEQTGGALFIDLPANMIGSALMGVMSSPVSSWPNIPWLRADHPLQNHNAMHVAIRTGLCGSLTTFASWNAQMVVMLDGTGLPLGQQIVPAIFGYILGLQASIACFLFGRKLNVWLNQWRNRDVCVELDGRARRSRGGIGMFGGQARISSRGSRRSRSSTQTLRHRNRRDNGRLAGVPEDIAIISGNGSMPLSEAERRRMKKEKRRRDREAKYADNSSRRGSFTSDDHHHHDHIPARIIVFPTLGDIESDDLCLCILGFVFSWRTVPLLLVSILFSLYVVADVVWGLPFYRTMWLSVLFTPLGAILRWKLQLLNGGKICKSRRWLPSGTIIANMIGSIVAIAAVAIETRFTSGGQSSWSVHVLAAVKIGFAGSLSTVSSVMKEIVDITERYPSSGKGYIYAFATLAICCALSLIVYSPVVRS